MEGRKERRTGRRERKAANIPCVPTTCQASAGTLHGPRGQYSYQAQALMKVMSTQPQLGIAII